MVCLLIGAMEDMVAPAEDVPPDDNNRRGDSDDEDEEDRIVERDPTGRYGRVGVCSGCSVCFSVKAVVFSEVVVVCFAVRHRSWERSLQDCVSIRNLSQSSK